MKINFWIRHDSINNFKWGNGGCHENSWITWRIGFIKGVSETIRIEAKKIIIIKGRFPGTLLGTLAWSLSENTLAGKGVIRGSDGVIGTGEGLIRTGQYF